MAEFAIGVDFGSGDDRTVVCVFDSAGRLRGHLDLVSVKVNWPLLAETLEEQSGDLTEEQRAVLEEWKRRPNEFGGETVECKFCHQQVPAETAHLHQGTWVGDDCCWDERLRMTE